MNKIWTSKSIRIDSDQQDKKLQTTRRKRRRKKKKRSNESSQAFYLGYVIKIFSLIPD